MKDKNNNSWYLFRYISFILFVLIVISCNKNESNSPVEPETNDSNENTFTTLWYGGQEYSLDSLQTWGLGNTLVEYIHNDTDYDWYIDQAKTGPASGNNCGPSSVTMAIKWFDKNFSHTAEEARNMFPNDGGWWYTNNIIDYLNYYHVINATVGYTGQDQLEGILRDGSIAILCINTGYLRLNSKNRDRVDRFYSYSGGHFFVVKGIRKVDSETYFEVYDPNNWNAKYSDGSPKGKNRHYRASDLSNAIKNWWNYVIVISKNKLNKNVIGPTENPANIKNMWGK